MRPSPAAILVFGGTFYIGMLLTAKGAMFPNKQPLEPLRERIEFCSLLQQEVKLNLAGGLTTEQKAEALITRCFNTYNK